RDVAEAETAAADDARAEPHQPKLVDIDAECRNQKATAPAEGGDHAGSAWPDPLEPAAPEGGRGAEQHEEQRVHPAEIKLAPVAARGEERLQRACRLFAKGGRAGRAFGNRLAVGGQERTLQRLPE